MDITSTRKRAKELRAIIPEELVLQPFNVEAMISIILWVMEQDKDERRAFGAVIESSR